VAATQIAVCPLGEIIRNARHTIPATDVPCGPMLSTIAARIDAGESVEAVAADYELARSEIEHAIVYERAA
jgi:hypothetical protein